MLTYYLISMKYSGEIMDFQQSQTYKNLQSLYAELLQSSTKYNIFSIRAEKEVYIGIENIFSVASRNERFISEKVRSLLLNGIPNTYQNLVEASNDESAGSDLVRNYARVANEEGYTDISALFSGIANIMLNHTSTFQNSLQEFNNNQLFCRNNNRLWICLGCGNILAGECAPLVCPVCGYPQGYYELFQ